MKKEGKKVMDVEQTQDIIGQLGQVGGLKPGRQVRRDQFEPSQENQGVFGNLARVAQPTADNPTPKSTGEENRQLFTARLGADV